MDLSKKRCKPCEGGIAPLDQQEIAEYKRLIKDGWEVRDNNKISKEFVFVNYRHTMDFVNKVADLAEEEGHHPVMHVYYEGLLLTYGHMPLTDYQRMILSWPLKLINYKSWPLGNLRKQVNPLFAVLP